MKKTLSFLLLCALLLGLTACADPVIGQTQENAPVQADASAVPEAVIRLEGDSASYPGGGVAISGSVITIGAPGSYTLRGTLNDGRIIVDLKENPGKVSLYLDGADISCLTDSALYLVQANELNLILVEGSQNRLVSGTEADIASYDATRHGAAIYAEDDLDIQGTGSLTVLGYLNNGITCKDDLKLKGGRLLVYAVNHGVRASESVTMTGGTVDIEAGGDGLKSSSAKKADKGFVQIEDGVLTVVSGGDGISAETELRILGGSITVTAEGDLSTVSCKGLKGKTGVTISGGSISVTADDHALRSQAALTVSGGMLQLRSRQGKGLSAETELLISGGSLTVSAADDGLSSADTVRITGGEVLVESGADGIQGGKKSTGFTAAVGTVSLEGGRTFISAFNKPVDAKASFQLLGGTLFACGNGKQPTLDSASTPYLVYSLQGHAGEELIIDASDSLTMTAAYGYSFVLCADSAITEGQRCTLHAGSQTLETSAGK